MKNETSKSRCFFITANESAECYASMLEAIKDCNYTLYALIKHDKDVNEDGTFKKEHYHAMVELANPVSFLSMQKRFKGAHIEIPNFKKSAYQYLVHNSPKSKTKYQYSLDEIVTNSKESIKSIIESEEIEPFIENNFLRYIAQGCDTQYRFVKRFGFEQYYKYWKTYYQMILELKVDREMQEDFQKVDNALNEEMPF